MGTDDRAITVLLVHAAAGMLLPGEPSRKGRNHDLLFFFFFN